MSKSEFQIENDILSVRTSEINRCLRKVLPVSLGERIVHAEYYPAIAGAMTDRHLKMTKAIPTSKQTTTNVASVFLDHCITLYGIPNHLLANNGLPFLSKIFATLCGFLELKHPKKTTYHFQTNLHVERHKNAIIRFLRHWGAEHQDNWNKFFQPLTYAYSTKTHRCTGFIYSIQFGTVKKYHWRILIQLLTGSSFRFIWQRVTTQIL